NDLREQARSHSCSVPAAATDLVSCSDSRVTLHWAYAFAVPRIRATKKPLALKQGEGLFMTFETSMLH
ncbi:hypothetical protein, partial [uncultured Pseudomonas sp.]|uniref:hypothetical protein n=1 Tax=uncultured Pseudomonas sp. TaxID=114707 RepID=UPI0027DB4D80